MDPIVLCADSESLRHPEMMGLAGARLDEISWLRCFSAAEDVRGYGRAMPMPQEFWVVSADDMEAINVAAALKGDEPLRTVRLVVEDATGSVLSRAHAAQVDETLPLWRFAQRFRTEVQRRSAGPATTADQVRSAASVPGKAADATLVMEPVAKADSEAPAAAFRKAVDQAMLAAGGPGGAAGASAGGRRAFVLTVASGSGGAGKTTVALYGALMARARGLRTLLVDGDMQFGGLRDLLGAKGAPTVADALQAPDPAALVAGQGGFAFIAAPRKLEEAELCAPHLPRLVDALAPGFDVIVVDTGASWTDCHAPLFERSNRTLMLIDQRASSVRAAQHGLDVCLRSGIATGSFLFALNRCSRHGLFTSIDVSCALNGAHVVELKDGGSAVEEACGAGMPGELLDGKCAFCDSLAEVLDGMLPARAGASDGRGSVEGPGLSRASRRAQRRGRHGKRARMESAEAAAVEAPAVASRPAA